MPGRVLLFLTRARATEQRKNTRPNVCYGIYIFISVVGPRNWESRKRRTRKKTGDRVYIHSYTPRTNDVRTYKISDGLGRKSRGGRMGATRWPSVAAGADVISPARDRSTDAIIYFRLARTYVCVYVRACCCARKCVCVCVTGKINCVSTAMSFSLRPLIYGRKRCATPAHSRI